MSRLIALFAVLLMGWPAAMFPQQAAVEQTRAVASAALPTLRQLVSQQKNYREMGFDSPDEVAKAALGDPFQVFMVRLDELGKYSEEQDPNTLLHERKQVLYPVVVGSEVRSSITVASTAKGWQATSFGSPNRTKLLWKARTASLETSRLVPSSYFVVEVPGLKLVFVGYREGGKLMLTPILNHPTFNLREGVAMPAAKVFAAIRPATKSHMDAPS